MGLGNEEWYWAMRNGIGRKGMGLGRKERDWEMRNGIGDDE